MKHATFFRKYVFESDRDIDKKPDQQTRQLLLSKKSFHH